MRISVVTVVFNNERQVEEAIESVLGQNYPDVEYVIVDGGSTDGTVEVIKKYEKDIAGWVSEPDEGIYDAMNKGLGMISGEVVGFLNSDDMYYNEQVLEKMAAVFKEEKWDACCGDILYVSGSDSQKINRHWKTGPYREGAFQEGWVPPHPGFFVKKKILDAHGHFNLAFPISADFELMLRLIERFHIKIKYIPEVVVKMRWGGNSTRNLKSIVKGNLEKYRAFKTNKVKVSPLYFLNNFLYKFKQLKLKS